MVRLEATKGRTERVGDTKNGSYAEMIAYGVPYNGDSLDVSIRIDMKAKSREAWVTATVLDGTKVRFLTGVNYHEGAQVSYGKGYISVWGVHPADVSSDPKPIGGGMFFSSPVFSEPEKTGDMVRIISRPASKIRTRVVSASTKEAELNNARRFESYMQDK